MEIKKFFLQLSPTQKVFSLALLASLVTLLWFTLLSSVTTDSKNKQTIEIEKETALLDCSGKNETSPLCEERSEALASIKKLKALKSELLEINVELWSEQEYKSILSLEEEGDDLFENGFFGKSSQIYTNAILQSEVLINEGSLLFNQYIEDGYKSLAEKNKLKAEDLFKKAIMIFPESESALNGLSRAGVLEDVLKIKEEVELLMKINSFDDALLLLQKASNLDDKNEEIINLKLKLEKLILERDLRLFIEKGYLSLEKKDFSSSRSAFKEAIKIDRYSTAAISGLRAVDEGEKKEKIKLDRIKAEDYFKIEDFQNASTTYSSLLQLDKNLGFALTGLDKVKTYIKLESQLDRYLQSPKRVSSKAVFEEAKELYLLLSQFTLGKRLTSKYNDLQGLLNQYSIPLTIQLTSDNRTQISIKNGQDLGKFFEKDIEMFAGSYTFIGKRKGYVTIRKEIELMEGGALFLVCKEKL